MHSILSIALIIALTVSGSVHCQPRDNIVTYDITDHTLGDLLGPIPSATFLNEICQQTPDDHGIAQGAISWRGRRGNHRCCGLYGGSETQDGISPRRPRTPFHAGFNELLFVLIALTLTWISVDCDRSCSNV
jgi:hypothetical protein